MLKLMCINWLQMVYMAVIIYTFYEENRHHDTCTSMGVAVVNDANCCT